MSVQRLFSIVDRELAGTTSAAKFVTVVPASAPIIGILLLGLPFLSIWGILSIGFAILWVVFIIWRSFRLVRLAAIKSDNYFDRRGKYQLPEEYHSTQSATAARKKPNG